MSGSEFFCFELKVDDTKPWKTKTMASFMWLVLSVPISTNFYLSGDSGQDDCPAGSSRVATEADCQAAAGSYHYAYGSAGCFSQKTRGCLENGNALYFHNCDDNTKVTAANHKPVCVKGNVQMYVHVHTSAFPTGLMSCLYPFHRHTACKNTTANIKKEHSVKVHVKVALHLLKLKQSAEQQLGLTRSNSKM